MSRRLQTLQVESEIKQLLAILETKKINRMLEIGTYHGGTLFLFSRVLPTNSIMYSLDMPEGKFEGGCPDWWVSVIKHIPEDNQEIHFIRADSHNPETKSELQEMLNGQELDFLFIDGDHTYEGVRRDFEMYSPLVGVR